MTDGNKGKEGESMEDGENEDRRNAVKIDGKQTNGLEG